MANQAKGWEGGGHLPKYLFRGKYRFGNTNELGKNVTVPCLAMVGLTQNEAGF